jgi:NuA3 HAT complex component NTO1
LTAASCYGNPLVQSIPDGDWFCSAKKSKAAARPSYCLCSVKGGAMKRTTEGQNLRSVNNLRSTINR